MTRSAPNAVATIDQFIEQVGSVKTASDGSTPLSEPGSIGGETTHPVKKVDDRLEKAKEGDRFKENTKDVNEDQGAVSVQKAPEASTKAAASIFAKVGNFAKRAEGGAVSTPGSAEDDHISTTMKVAPTGEDSANETNSAKAGKEDKKQGGVGGTSHPASTENDSLDGHKYAADTPLEKLATDMQSIGNNLLAAIHNLYQGNGIPAPQQTKQAAAAQPQPKGDPNLAFLAGHELAGLVNGTFDKNAADAMVHSTICGIVKQAADDADMFIHYANNFFKAAEGEEADPTAGGGGGEPPAPEAGGGGAGGPGGGAGGAGGGGEEDMMAALGGGAGGDPSGGMGGGMGGGGDAEAEQLAQILQQLGVTAPELEQALAAAGHGGGGGDPMGGGMGGGADPMAGGGDPSGGGGGGMEAQAGAGNGKRNAGHSKVAASEMRNYIAELVTRSKARR